MKNTFFTMAFRFSKSWIKTVSAYFRKFFRTPKTIKNHQKPSKTFKNHQKPSKTQQFPQFHRFYRPFKLPQSSTALAQHRSTVAPQALFRHASAASAACAAAVLAAIEEAQQLLKELLEMREMEQLLRLKAWWGDLETEKILTRETRM